jgi:hypothetical protein
VTYRGRVKNGVVVLDAPSRLEDGTVVKVEPVPASNGRASRTKKPRRGSPAAILPHVGTWAGQPGEMDRLLRAVREMKQAEVAARKAALPTAGPNSASNGRSPNRRKRRS